MKIEEQVLSREQMKHLQELGVDTSDASMIWKRERLPKIDNYESVSWKVSPIEDWMNPYLEAFCDVYIPTYTIGDLIEKLPIEINSHYRGIEILRNYVGAGYFIEKLCPFSFSDLSLLESLYNLLCWVAETHKELLDAKK